MERQSLQVPRCSASGLFPWGPKEAWPNQACSPTLQEPLSPFYKEPKAQRMHHSAIFKISRYNRCPQWLTQVSKHLCVPCLLVGCRLAGPGWLCWETSSRLQSDPSGLLLPGPPGLPGPTLWRLQEHQPPLSLTLLIRKAHSTVVLSLLGWRRSP